jgi:eukaryotic-like serine/threonine-protein kinase
MTLAPGAQLGGYEILGSIGVGGMGEVYRARDKRLNRDVAIKILPSLFAADPERLARFEREAQMLASLNHPNIAQIHGLEETGGVRALVMELVEGETLAARLARGPMPVEEALAVAKSIAEALEAAHVRGIIHRDLKPANVALRPDGAVKVLDFGLAKALMPSAEGDVANSPTFTTLGATHQGMILGTAAYMAPEQAKGRPVDTRADIWAFGAVLFEMLTGRPLYSGETASEILARVIEREPDWSRLPEGTRAPIRHLLRRCLTKDPKRRLQSIGDARIDIEEAFGAPDEAEAAPPAVRRRERLWAALAALASLIAAILAVLLLRASAPDPAAVRSLRAAIALPQGLYLDGVGPPEVALSPDGRTLAFLARGTTGAQQLYVRKLDSATATLVPSSQTAEGPFFSPDGRWVAFAVGVSTLGGTPPELRKYSLETGLTQTICAVEDYFGGAWRADGSILYVDAQPKGLWTVPAGGGERRPLVARFRKDGTDAQRAVAWPELLPDGRSVLLTDWSTSSFGSLATVDLETRDLTPLGLNGSGPRLLPNGYLLYADPSAVLMGARFDVRERRVVSTPVALLPDIAIGRNNVPVFAVDHHGTLVFATGYLSGSRREPMRLVRATASGQVTALPFEPDLFHRGFALSSDGTRLAASTWGGSRWLLDLARGTRVKLPSAATMEVNSLAWSPDGRRLALTGPAVDKPLWGLFLQPADGSGSVEPLIPLGPEEIFAAGWTPDGRTLVAWRTLGAGGGMQILAIDAGQRPRIVLEESGGTRGVRVSPDGRWVAFDSTASGDFQVQVAPVSGQGRRVAVTANGGYAARWSRDGRQLFYRRDRALLAVEAKTSPDGIHFGPERTLFEWDTALEYEVGPQGEFYSVQPLPGGALQRAIQLRTNWLADVERRVGGN